MSSSLAADLETRQLPPTEEGDESGLELELDDPNATISDPFDPEKVKIHTVNIVVALMVTRIEHGDIELAPDFQRHSGIWSAEGKSRLIESLLLRIPIPVFYVAADRNEVWSVVDGVQRMSTIYNFVTGQFALEKLQYLTQLHGCRHADLSRPLQRRISETQLIVNVIQPGTPEEVMFNIFLRINTGGEPLRGQEIRHALNAGPVRKYLEDLAGSPEFLEATAGSIASSRMADRECVLRFLAFHIDPPEKYLTSDLDGYLGRAMKKINGMTAADRSQYDANFRKAMRAAHGIFGEQAFRKPPGESGRRRPISKALFEAWGVHLASCSSSEIESLIAQRGRIERRFRQLMEEDSDFDNAISYGTSAPGRVHKRFEAIKQLVEEFV